MPLAYIGLGSNLGDASGNLERALEALAAVGTVIKRSSFFAGAAWGETAQPAFVNAAAAVETALSPHELLAALQVIEVELGRTPTYRWGPRVIDLDILDYADAVIREERLVIPHERLYERAFALAPLAEIAPQYRSAFHALPAAARASVQRIEASAARSRTTVNWEETLDRVRGAAEFCASAGLARLRIEEESLGIDIRRTPGVPSAPEPALADGLAPGAAAASNGALARIDPPLAVLRAEFVGIVRLSRPSVHDGSVVAEDRELAYVESLGIRNPIRSGGAGRIAHVFVSDGEAVEFGQPLFSIDK